MPDVLIRGLDQRTIQQLDRQAKHLGLPRAELIRRILESVARRQSGGSLTRENLADFASAYGDLADPDVMRSAWS